jgi:hypothetical protein
LTPQLESVPVAGHSEAACADEMNIKLGVATIIAKAIAFDIRMLSSHFSFTKSGRLPPAQCVDLDQKTSIE